MTRTENRLGGADATRIEVFVAGEFLTDATVAAARKALIQSVPQTIMQNAVAAIGRANLDFKLNIGIEAPDTPQTRTIITAHQSKHMTAMILVLGQTGYITIPA